jgi:hypothetical protein
MTGKANEVLKKSLLEKNVTSAHTKSEKFIFWSGDGKIIPHLLYEYFKIIGVGKYYPESSKWKYTDPLIVKINGNVVSVVNVNFLLEMAKNYIYAFFEEISDAGPVIDSLHKSTSLFGDKNLKLLETLKLKFISDDRDSGYFFFRNGIVEVTKDGITLSDYDDFDLFIWENSIINLDFQKIDPNTLYETCNFMEFLHDLTKVEDENHSEERLKALKSAMGYLLHRYKDGNTNKAIILMDIFVNGMPNGGSGKSLLINSVSRIRNVATIDGKIYDQREWFALSSVGLDSDVLLFDDVEKNFNFEQIFPLTSGGMYIRRKYKDHIHIPHEKSPKIALTTNYAINGDSSSFQRRKFEFEVSPTYSANYSPRDKFGRMFFDDWLENEWNLFYNTMLHCLMVFLENGLFESKPINIRLTKLINNSTEEFVEFANYKLKLDEQLDKKALYDEFIKDFPEFKYGLKQRTFTQWLRAWGEYKNLNLIEGHSGFTRYVIFSN